MKDTEAAKLYASMKDDELADLLDAFILDAASRDRARPGRRERRQPTSTRNRRGSPRAESEPTTKAETMNFKHCICIPRPTQACRVCGGKHFALDMVTLSVDDPTSALQRAVNPSPEKLEVLSYQWRCMGCYDAVKCSIPITEQAPDVTQVRSADGTVDGH